MIKVLLGFKVKKGADIQPILLKLRSYSLSFPNFVSAEYLRSEQDDSIVSISYNWERIEDYREWESSTMIKQILKEAKELTVDEPKVTIYTTIAPSSGWDKYPNIP